VLLVFRLLNALDFVDQALLNPAQAATLLSAFLGCRAAALAFPTTRAVREDAVTKGFCFHDSFPIKGHYVTIASYG
jgi:hypothetical protein